MVDKFITFYCVPYWLETLVKQLILDFLDEVVRKPTVLVGNSVGSLACIIAASGMLGMESPNSYYSKAIWKREAQKRTVRTHMIYYDSFLMWKLCPFIDA